MLKDIKNVPPGLSGAYFCPAANEPRHHPPLRDFRLGWIKEQQQKIRAQERETPREYLDRESHLGRM